MSKKLKEMAQEAVKNPKFVEKEVQKVKSELEDEIAKNNLKKEAFSAKDSSQNAFVKAAACDSLYDARTENGMRAMSSTLDACVDFFFKAGAMRGQNILPVFQKAYKENTVIALQIALWLRDIRGGAGERKLFRDIVKYLSETVKKYSDEEKTFLKLLDKIPQVGRFDDLLETGKNYRQAAYDIIKTALENKNGLCAKWMPRQGTQANQLRKYFDLTPKEYRKLLVSLTNVVETLMCENLWNEVQYNALPSLAFSRYSKAFRKHDGDRFSAYIESVNKGEEKINASAVYPYDIIKNLRQGNEAEADAQWANLPDYLDGATILPMVDVSGSMNTGANPAPIDVAVSLGIYLSQRSKSAFKDLFLTFSANPAFQLLKGSLSERVKQLNNAQWNMNTDIVKAFKKLLDIARQNKVGQKDMPSILLILSDMQFDQCAEFDDGAMQSVERNYQKAGYEVPKIVFWNLADRGGNIPVSFNKNGVALVSGFSPAIMKAALKNDKNFNPYSIMLQTVDIERYRL
ncbi:MAG: DUF2828 family protein [Endomicrobium sp.]|jgi:hypothetical protein|nr:DUF2828 family protein [Endomicrobium sp.]